MQTDNMQIRLMAMARESTWFWPALVAARDLRLPAWCIGAGAVRNLVWDALHHFQTPSALPDIDVAYFDTSDLSATRDAHLQRRLSIAHPVAQWEVTNQAGVHTWFEATFGHTVTPLLSLEDGIASWPEFATAVGITLHDDDSMDVIAPYGLDDLFAMVVRRNPVRVSEETYHRRVEEKRYQQRWPNVTVIPG